MPADPSGTLDVLVTYRTQTGKEDAAEALLQRHWPLLHSHGLVTDTKALVWRTVDGNGDTYFYEVFTWTSAEALDEASANEEIGALWDEMAAAMAGQEIQRAARVAIG